MYPRETIGRLVTHDFIDVTLEHGGNCAARTMVHPVIELEVADRKLGIVDVKVQRVEIGLVDAIVLGELGIEALERIEVPALVSVKERLAEEQVLLGQVVVISKRAHREREAGDQKRRPHHSSLPDTQLD